MSRTVKGNGVVLDGVTLAPGVNLSRKNYRRIRFEDIDFSSCDFTDADLASAEFVRCRFGHTTFSRTKLVKAKFIDCELEGTIFDNCNLHQVEGIEYRHFSFSENGDSVAVTLWDAGEGWNCSFRGACYDAIDVVNGLQPLYVVYRAIANFANEVDGSKLVAFFPEGMPENYKSFSSECPKCGQFSNTGRVNSFFVELDEHGDSKYDLRELVEDTEVAEGVRYCGECNLEFDLVG
ncbi:MAG: pentapeptide repeat-containing protein [Verrucomicrobiota bacterium]